MCVGHLTHMYTHRCEGETDETTCGPEELGATKCIKPKTPAPAKVCFKVICTLALIPHPSTLNPQP